MSGDAKTDVYNKRTYFEDGKVTRFLGLYDDGEVHESRVGLPHLQSIAEIDSDGDLQTWDADYYYGTSWDEADMRALKALLDWRLHPEVRKRFERRKNG